MTASNQIPAADTALPQVSNPSDSISDKDLSAFINACKGQPASLDESQVFEFDRWFAESGVTRRAALLIATRPYDELEKEILNNREIAVAMADVERCIDHVADGFKLMHDIVIQSKYWILVALSKRDDALEIVEGVRNDAGGADAEPVSD